MAAATPFLGPTVAATSRLYLGDISQVRLWRLARNAIASSLNEWKSIVGWRGADGASNGASSNLSVVRDFPSPKPASMPKHGKVDPTGAPHVGGNTWAGADSPRFIQT